MICGTVARERSSVKVERAAASLRRWRHQASIEVQNPTSLSLFVRLLSFHPPPLPRAEKARRVRSPDPQRTLVSHCSNLHPHAPSPLFPEPQHSHCCVRRSRRRGLEGGLSLSLLEVLSGIGGGCSSS
jgi:hypothetical protein